MRGQSLKSAILLLAFTTLAPAQGPTAFVHVSVVPMDSQRVIANQTVLIDSGRIVGIGPAGAGIAPTRFRVVDGRGLFLMPGLGDMHVHFMRDSTELLLYLANGVTEVRELSGEPLYLTWRREISAGSRVGPNIYLTSPVIDGPTGRRAAAWFWGCVIVISGAMFVGVRAALRRGRAAAVHPTLVLASGLVAAAIGYAGTIRLVPFPDSLLPQGATARWWIGAPWEAAHAVRQAAQQYDQVKLYDRLSPAEFEAAVRTAREIGIHTVAHVPPAVGLTRALNSGMDELAHIYFLVIELQETRDTSSIAYAQRLQQIVGDVRRAHVDVTSTLMPMPEMLEQLTDSAALLARDNFKYRTPAARQAIRQRMHTGASAGAVRDIRTHVTWGSVAAFDLVRAGIPLVLGTDNSPITGVAGFGVQDEVQMFVESGMTPYEALRTATVNASRIVGAGKQWGTIAVGQRADLLMLDANPLDGVRTLQRPRGVVAAGRWYDRQALDSLLAIVVQRRAATPSSQK